MGTDRQRKIFVRPAQLGDRLVTAQFVDHRGFADARDPDIEVCVPAGAELAFDLYLECEPRGPQLSPKKIRRKRAQFASMPLKHSDGAALKFKDKLVLRMTRLRPGQYAAVVKLPGIPPPAQDPTAGTNEYAVHKSRRAA
jgi:hypothetical protein